MYYRNYAYYFILLIFNICIFRSVRRSFRVISYRKKKKEKKRNNSGELSVAKANIEGNDEARTLQGMIIFNC